MGGRSGIWWGAVACSLVMPAFSRSAAALVPVPGGSRLAIMRLCSQQDRRRLLSADLLA
jgi:hypothetical protein